MDKLLTKDDTKVMKAIAIILMLIHHLWGFPERMAGGGLRYLFHIFDQSSIGYMGMFGKICVSLFFFLGGYGIYISSYGKKFDIIGKLKSLYVSYWKVFLIFIPIAFIFFGNQPIYCEDSTMCTRFALFRWRDFLMNFIGLDTTYNGEWWFLTSYVYAVVTFPVVRHIVERHSAKINIGLVIVGSILMTNLFPAIGGVEQIGLLNENYLYRTFFCQTAPYIACFWMGIVVAKDGLLSRLRDDLQKHRLLNPLSDILIWGVITYLRQMGPGDSLDIVYIPFMIVTAMDLLDRLSVVKKVLLYIGKESTNMWLIHSFFCYYFYGVVKIVVAPKWAVPSLMILLVLTYIASVCVSFFWRKLEKGFDAQKRGVSDMGQ